MLTRISENGRFQHIKLEQLQGEILILCKDQHGCRFLQKKLEERNPEHVHLIFLETHPHVVELMTGNSVFSTPAFNTNNIRSVRQLPLPKAV